MTIRPELRQRVLKFIVEFKGLIQKTVAALIGRKSAYYLLSKTDRAPIDEDTFRETLAALKARPAHAAVTAGWIESMKSLDQADGPTPEERDEIEMALFRESQDRRALYFQLARRLRDLPPLEGYPEPGHREPLRWFARLQLKALKALETEEERLAVVQECREYQHWALMEIVAEESPEAASRGLEEAAFWARLAVEIAERVRGPEEWVSRVRGYAGLFGPNTLRVAGELDLADVRLEAIKPLWLAGSDPDQVLDPGRLFDIEASLRRAQRRFDEALDRLADARPISHNPARVLINQSSIQAVMGEHEGALESLREAKPLVEPQRDPRLFYILCFNTAVVYTHVGNFAEAAALLKAVRQVVAARGDENEIPRVNWLRGRIAAGLGRNNEARALLEQALRQLKRKKLWYDVALALLELAALLLHEGKTAEVKALTSTLAEIFESKKVHAEALIALGIFKDAVEREAADEELARRVLTFLFRAGYDQDLKYES
ncbi:MAG TPA: tetratricopeptide repeat protein [Thermoanaerobaculia bacterium]|nr:tetratricopeptide repeat protein [Thermoanaerobaculia bacterium]